MIKVTATKEINGKHYAEAKLVLIKRTWGEVKIDDVKKEVLSPHVLIDHDNSGFNTVYSTVLISESEEILEGDWVIDVITNDIWQASAKSDRMDFLNKPSSVFKILALSEDFSKNQLIEITEGTLKEVSVWVECDSNIDQIGSDNDKLNTYIKSPLTLHKVEETWEDIFEKKSFVAAGNLQRYLKDNYNVPTLKTENK